MSTITLKTPSCQEVTVLSNVFIDEYMPEANGEFVKVYVYLLRTLSSAPVSFSLDQIADHLMCTERDILRALKYWDRCGLLSLTFPDEGDIYNITLQAPSSRRKPEKVTPIPAPKAVVKDRERDCFPEESETEMDFSPERLAQFHENEEITQLFYVAEKYLGKPLTGSEAEAFLYFYEELHFSTDLIEYLIEYSIGGNHTDVRYMQKVAHNWHKEGVTTVEEAKKATYGYKKEYRDIMRAFGINNHNPIEGEVKLMDRWLYEYQLSMEVIQEAANRTLIQIGKPSLNYADSILREWSEKSVRTLDDIKALDGERETERLKRPAEGSPGPANRFNNFQQRSYNFDEYEKQLLNQ